MGLLCEGMSDHTKNDPKMLQNESSEIYRENT